MSGFLRKRQNRFVGAAKTPLRNDKVAFCCASRDRRSGVETGFDMIAVEPVVCIQQADAVIFLADRDQRADAARCISVIAMLPIQLEVPDLFAVDPRLRKTIGNEKVIGRYGLISYALDAALQ